MTATRTIASFGTRGAAVVDADDYEALKGNRYRLDCFGYVVRSAPSGPGDHRNRGVRSLARDVGDLMGLPSDRTVTFRDGNSLDATRGNLEPGGRRGVRTMTRPQHSQPPGVHRKRAGAGPGTGSSVPPRSYVLTYHEPPCAPDDPDEPGQVWHGCRLKRRAEPIGAAIRVSKLTATGHSVPAGWDMRSPWGDREAFGNFFDGVEWLLSLRAPVAKAG